MYEVKVGYIKREGRAAEHDKRPLDGIGYPISKCAQHCRRPERHEHKEQAGRVLRDVDEIDERADRTVVNLQGVGIAVDASPPEHNKCRRRRHAPGE